MPLLLSLSRSSKTSLMTHSARLVTLGYLCPSGPTMEPSLPSPPLKGDMHAIGITGPVCDLSPPLIPLASQGLCMGVGGIVEGDALQGFTQSLRTRLQFAYQWEPLKRTMLIFPSKTWHGCSMELSTPGTQFLSESALLRLRSPLSENCYLTLCAPRAKCFNLHMTTSLP